ncbi:triphosphoribosyl-dephospho-CoA synthase MdcB [Undibacterium terreum]|uniref:triphosphoribosyl-dephospho-CoA synthase n=1 Tax=Undibacterium terreum TaxID=1224302 RepID=A0A916U4M9_9BURK|nr:triphosphoribosyl-dephospho-CoA synthase MdcB [Undibacterium terreum]GGC59611.1 putative 2-(5''-triphosphoribosyl)-3'-dephosphocoenzyme-A synthase [Undibacterium terreum]
MQISAMHKALFVMPEAAALPRKLFKSRRLQNLRTDRTFAGQVSRVALRSLHAELLLYPKPGLVSPIDNGSHLDMTAATFVRSLFSLRRYFADVTLAGMQARDFEELKLLGIQAERRMLRATAGINTHRGAIFSLGMLAAAIGSCKAQGITLTAAAVRAVLLIQWGEALAAHTEPVTSESHGRAAAERYAASGAREEAAMGFPSIFEVALPRLHAAIDAGRGMEEAQMDVLFALIAHISDTNLYHRGGLAGAVLAKAAAQEFLDQGATSNPQWRETALQVHKLFVQHRLSPGGAADLLAATCMLQQCISQAVAD